MIKTIFIDDIDLSEHLNNPITSRSRFFNNHDRMWYKIWKRDSYLWGMNVGSTFMNALRDGFFEGLTDIWAIILASSGECVGHVTHSIDINKNKLKLYKHKKHNFEVIDNHEKQSNEYKTFWKELCERTAKTGYFFWDLTYSNIGINKNNRYSLIDLESIVLIENIESVPLFHRKCCAQDYLEYSLSLLKRPFIDMNLVRKAWSIPTGGMNHSSYYSVVINGEYFEGERPWFERWKFIKSCMDWEGKRVLDLGTCMAIVPIYLMKYCGVKSSTGVDFNEHHIQASKILRDAFKISSRDLNLLHLDLDGPDYEYKIGYNFDVVFCLSLLRWIKDQNRLLKYLSIFKYVIVEPHDLDGDIVRRFKNIGFLNYNKLGETEIEKISRQKRELFLFSK